MTEYKQGFDKIWQLARIDNTELRMLGGVAAGIAYTFSIAPWIVRLLFALSALFSFGTTILIYLILWMILPKITVDKASFNRRVSNISVSSVVADKDFNDSNNSNSFTASRETQITPDVIITPAPGKSSFEPLKTSPETTDVEDVVVKPSHSSFQK